MNNKSLVVISVILGLIFFYIGYVYASRGAGSLPTYFPGYEAGVVAKHTKHALASFIVGLACFVFAWFKSGPKKA